jgi:uncharacterized integral membrane protein
MGNREYPFEQCLAVKKGVGMRYVYIGLLIVALAVVILFKVQNLTSVTITLLGMSATMSVSMLVFCVYVLGMLTGGLMWSLLRGSIRGASRASS